MKVFIAHSMRDQEVTLAPADAMRAQGYEPIDPLSMIRAGDLLSQVSTLIRSADAFVAILTERNANVYL